METHRAIAEKRAVDVRGRRQSGFGRQGPRAPAPGKTGLATGPARAAAMAPRVSMPGCFVWCATSGKWADDATHWSIWWRRGLGRGARECGCWSEASRGSAGGTWALLSHAGCVRETRKETRRRPCGRSTKVFEKVVSQLDGRVLCLLAGCSSRRRQSRTLMTRGPRIRTGPPRWARKSMSCAFLCWRATTSELSLIDDAHRRATRLLAQAPPTTSDATVRGRQLIRGGAA